MAEVDKMKVVLITLSKLFSILLFSLTPLAHSYAQGTTTPKPVDRKKFVEQVCFRIQSVAKAQGIPEAFLARLIWKESRFDPNAVSPVGAQGIAQFMPATARLRGLKDPFEPNQAIAASASYLIDLRNEFGNWGLAAAAYNAGPGRVANWRAGRSGLPFETQDFVATITGHAAEEWTQPDFQQPKFGLSETEDFLTACKKFRTKYSLFRNTIATAPTVHAKPWGVQVAGHFNRSQALKIYSRLKNKYPALLRKKTPQIVRKRNRSFGNRPRYNIRIGANSRAEGQAFCNRLKNAGGSCVVLRN